MVDHTAENLSAPAADPNRYPMTPAEIDALPYAAIGAQFEGSAKAVMVLATADSGTLQWVSGNNAVIETRQGLIVRTEGLERNLIATHWVAEDPLAALIANGKVESGVYRRVDVGHGAKVEKLVAVKSNFRINGREQIKVLDAQHEVWHVEERADFLPWRWQTVNHYWLGVEDRQVWRSVQRFTPELPGVELELLSPYTES